jgi:alkyldihydroxyacetonephosphate synthase
MGVTDTPGTPTPPIQFGGDAAAVRARLDAATVPIGDRVLAQLRVTGAEVTTDPAVLAESSRDWWPLGMIWALDGEVPGRAHAVVRPASAEQVAAVLAACNESGMPVTAAAGRSGVCGGSTPVHGGVVLDLTRLTGIIAVDEESMVLDVRAGTFGTALEDELRASHGVTVGHWPQSMDLSTVGGWLACRGAGQYSTRYGKIEDIVVGLDAVLADGRMISTGGPPRAAVGPDLTQLFVGSEGTLGIITGARLKLHPAPVAERRAAYGFPSFADGLDVCRRILRRGATPAVLRLYDAIEGERNFQTGAQHPLLVLDEGDPHIVDAVMAVVREECNAAVALDDAIVGRWLDHRNDVSALETLIAQGFVVDTMEIAASWRDLPAIYDGALAAIAAVEHTMVVSAHESHAYPDGACLYFTFAGRPSSDGREAYYRAAWDAGTRAVLAHGGSLSHHHGIGLSRARFVRDALGPAFAVLVAAKHALDPNGILNPGKLGLPSPFGPSPAWPTTLD